jgi:spoIIIJ-associated protein
MTKQEQINKIKETVEEFFEKMTMNVFDIVVDVFSDEKKINEGEGVVIGEIETVNLDIKVDDPQVLIGQQGQTLFEIQRILRTILNKKLGELLYLNLDIDGYKKKKIEYLKYLVKDYADQVAFSGKEKDLLPMSSYERRIVHAELSQRTDVATESRGEGFERHIVIKPS